MIPGSTVEFYLRFCSILGEEMAQSFNQALIHDHLNITQTQGIIKVVPKKRKKRLYLENIDYKIATKTIADTISKVLRKLINEDQTGYVKDRYMGQNIRLVKDIMEITSSDNISDGFRWLPGCIASQTTRGCHTEPSSFFACIPARKISGYIFSDLPVKRCESSLTFTTLAFVKVCESL